ncbi:MAG: heavy-metal-associated domain-containing protein [Polaribacter sp.]|nr:heavy-metal-associated domain-containing protein [Polaribacter sp.]MDG1811622.1 heavy-metal-associated domain-containing protein [Polaribacter sp.]MDG1994561.1 heavy-metal-associated domain-containing protein [Polaribacter sp.]
MNTKIYIENLKCGGCAATIKKGILSVNGVSDIAVNVDDSFVEITSDTENIDAVKEKLSKMGYPEVGDKNTVLHKAKSFVSCATGKMSSEA